MRKINWKYPLQEILIIIAGILLALGVNNWWAERQDDQLAQDYLSALQDDIRIDKTNIDRYNQRSQQMIVQPLERALKVFFAKTADDIDPDSLLNDIQMATYMNIFPIRTGTYEDLKSTGNIRLIKNDQLRNQLHDYHDRYEFYKMYYQSFLQGKIDVLEVLRQKLPFRYFHHDLDLRNQFESSEMPIDLIEILSDPELENVLIQELVTTRWINRSFENMAGRAASIDSILTTEISK